MVREPKTALAQAFVAVTAGQDDTTEAGYLRRVAAACAGVLQAEPVAAVWAGPDRRQHPVAPATAADGQVVEVVCGDNPTVETYRTTRSVRPALLTDLPGPWP